MGSQPNANVPVTTLVAREKNLEDGSMLYGFHGRMRVYIGMLTIFCFSAPGCWADAVEKDRQFAAGDRDRISNEAVQETATRLRFFSITAFPRYSFRYFGGAFIDYAKPKNDYYLLNRPGESNYVAVIQLEPKTGADSEEKFKLNPEGFNYGPIPALEKLSQAEADLLWGWGSEPHPNNETQKTDQEKTYILVARHQAKFPKEIKKTFLIHCRFESNKLVHYDIESPDFFDEVVP
jgi:hypothetical protein